MDLSLDAYVAQGRTVLTGAGRLAASLARGIPDRRAADALSGALDELHQISKSLGFGRIGALAGAAGQALAGILAQGAASLRGAALLMATIERIAALLDDTGRLRHEPAGSDDFLLGAMREIVDAGRAADKDLAPRLEPACGDTDTFEQARAHAADLLQLMDGCGYEQPLRRLLAVVDPSVSDGEPDAPEGGKPDAYVPPAGPAEMLSAYVFTLAERRGKDVTFAMTGDGPAVDAHMLARLQTPLLQMIRNAVDYGVERPEMRAQAGKPALASLRLSTEEAGADLVVTLSDDGCGFDPDKFRPRTVTSGRWTDDRSEGASDWDDPTFVPMRLTADRAAGPGGGMAAGLNLVRASVASLGGTVDLMASEGRGTAVRLRLPGWNSGANAPSDSEAAMASGEQASAVPDAPPPESAYHARPVALLVEPDRLARQMVTVCLIEAGYRVVVAGSGEEAVEILECSVAVAAVVSAARLPGMMTGSELATRIAGIVQRAGTPIVLLDDRPPLQSGRHDTDARRVTKFDRDGLVGSLSAIRRAVA